MFLEQFLHPRFEERSSAGGDHLDLAGIAVSSHDIPTDLGKPERSGQADVPEPQDAKTK